RWSTSSAASRHSRRRSSPSTAGAAARTVPLRAPPVRARPVLVRPAAARRPDMTAHVTASAPTPAPIAAPSTRRRLFALGSVFGKTLRDSRRAVLVVGGILALTIIAVTAAIASQFTTAESREELVAVIASVPAILQGLAGKPVNVGTLGGYMSYKYG